MENAGTNYKKMAMALLAMVTWFALLLQLKLSLESTATTGFSNTKTVINFFSYFTILSNCLVAVSLSASLVVPSSAAGMFFSKPAVMSAIAVYIFIVGLVYNLVLRGIWEPTGWQQVADNLLHVAVPVFYILFWGIFTPAGQLQWRTILPWLLFPFLYLIYSLVRGPIANWYPYPFLDAAKFGYGQVAINSILVLVAFLATSLGAVAFNRRGATKTRS